MYAVCCWKRESQSIFLFIVLPRCVLTSLCVGTAVFLQLYLHVSVLRHVLGNTGRGLLATWCHLDKDNGSKVELSACLIARMSLTILTINSKGVQSFSAKAQQDLFAFRLFLCIMSTLRREGGGRGINHHSFSFSYSYIETVEVQNPSIHECFQKWK